MLLKDYVKLLESYVSEYGDVEVAITQEGYYSDDPLAELYTRPLLQNIKHRAHYHYVTDSEGALVWKVNKPETNKEYFVIGHSEQNY